MAKPQRPKSRSRFPAPERRQGRASLGGMQQQLAQMQEEMARVQESLGAETVMAAAGGGMVTVVANGHQEIESITIAPEIVDPDDVEMLQDMVLAAVNEALQKAKELAESKMGALTGGLDLNIPGLM